ncbi:hydroxypyruvate isomerase [Pararhizobium haloflavum]|uniref:hydroxypyruvate isomerase n=1 Tax=Pararhizobium haloflavum TaxID=2037914 RepID=UPI000C1A8025|nr:hydroxypyruvate isomerase [Pararhizobium haloflavum]
MPKFAANLSMLFTEVPFLERFGRAAHAGFDLVECQFPYAETPEAIAAQLRKHGLTMVLHNLPAGDWEGGERGIAILPDRMEEFRRGVREAIGYAMALGVGQLNCLAGVQPEDISHQTLRKTFLDNLRFAAEALGEEGIRLLIEPVNRRDIPGFFLDTVEDAVALIEETGSSNIAVQYDLYHQQRTRGELLGTYRMNAERIGHIQLADNPGRNEPGTGEINFDHVFSALDEAGYDGVIGCEYKPRGVTEDGLGWLPQLKMAARRVG